VDKPTIKREVAIKHITKNWRIVFYASRDAAEDFSQYGTLFSDPGNQYTLFVDGRFDFDEVVDYIKNYG
jgi:hypothetical protein